MGGPLPGAGRSLPVLAQVAPGEIASRLPAAPRSSPSRSRRCCATSTRCCCPASPTGSTRATSPTSPPASSRAGDPRRAARGDAQLGRDPVADRAGLDRARGRRARLGRALLGLPAGWHGHIEDTASTSTLAAIIAAREATGRDLVVCSEQAHSSVDKAARMLGDAAAQGPVDDGVPAARRRARRSARARRSSSPRSARPRRRPSIRSRRSPTRASAAGAWLHVDAAYAGTAMVCPELRWAFDGVDRADSAGGQRAQVDADADGLLAAVDRAPRRAARARSAWCPSSCAPRTPRTRCR